MCEDVFSLGVILLIPEVKGRKRPEAFVVYMELVLICDDHWSGAWSGLIERWIFVSLDS